MLHNPFLLNQFAQLNVVPTDSSFSVAALIPHSPSLSPVVYTTGTAFPSISLSSDPVATAMTVPTARAAPLLLNSFNQWS
jgi:hypothetical protein